jgi:hypothetical protein
MTTLTGISGKTTWRKARGLKPTTAGLWADHTDWSNHWNVIETLPTGREVIRVYDTEAEADAALASISAEIQAGL